MTGVVIGVLGAAVLFAAFGVAEQRRARRGGRLTGCIGCSCSEFCERDGHPLGTTGVGHDKTT